LTTKAYLWPTTRADIVAAINRVAPFLANIVQDGRINELAFMRLSESQRRTLRGCLTYASADGRTLRPDIQADLGTFVSPELRIPPAGHKLDIFADGSFSEATASGGCGIVIDAPGQHAIDVPMYSCDSAELNAFYMRFGPVRRTGLARFTTTPGELSTRSRNLSRLEIKLDVGIGRLCGRTFFSHRSDRQLDGGKTTSLLLSFFMSMDTYWKQEQWTEPRSWKR
jgi:hypothetical protein